MSPLARSWRSLVVVTVPAVCLLAARGVSAQTTSKPAADSAESKNTASSNTVPQNVVPQNTVPQNAEPSSVVTNRITLSEPTVAAKVHPLDPVLSYALAEQVYLRNLLRDFSCRVVKRERLEGVLQEYQFLYMEMREELRQGDRIVQPLSVFLEYRAPALVAGRRVLYVKGRFDGRMLVRKGGPRFAYVVVDLDPFGTSAKRESGVPITEVGFTSTLTRMIGLLEQHRQADPTGDNTKVQQISGAKVNNRSCTVIRVEHPMKQSGLAFHLGRVFVDDQLHVPVRIDAYDWPEREGQEPPVIAEYTYTDLKLNPNLSDASFEPARVRGTR